MSVEEVLGGRPEEPVSVLVEVTQTDGRTHVPEDPNTPQPDGGFQITEYTGRVISTAP